MHIVLVNGWSATKNLWGEFIDLFDDMDQLDLVDLDRPYTLEQWRQEIDRYLRDDSVLMGWSLGGQLAAHCATRTTKQLKALCLMQSNPCFVAQSSWDDAMPLTMFDSFSDLVNTESAANVRRQFAHMMNEGSKEAKADRKALRGLYANVEEDDEEVLKAGMALLRTMDVRGDLSSIALPVLNILGANDSLVPSGLASRLPERIETVVIEGMAHVPCLAYKERVFAELKRFLAAYE